MSSKLEAAQDELNRFVKEKELLELRYQGDSHEMELLKVIFKAKHTKTQFKLSRSMNNQPNACKLVSQVGLHVFEVFHFIFHTVDARRLTDRLDHQFNGNIVYHYSISDEIALYSNNMYGKFHAD